MGGTKTPKKGGIEYFINRREIRTLTYGGLRESESVVQISTPPGRGSPPPGPGVGTAMVALPLWADPLPTTHTWPTILRHTNCWESVLKCETPAHCAEHLGKRVLLIQFIILLS